MTFAVIYTKMSEDSRTDVGGGMNSRYTKEARAVELLEKEWIQGSLLVGLVGPLQRERSKKKGISLAFCPKILRVPTWARI